MGRCIRASPTAADWSLELPNIFVTSTVGQSYRFTDTTAIFPEGTGLTGQFSDVVEEPGSATGAFWTSITAIASTRTTLAVRRNEVDFTIGSDQTYARIGYLRLNRNTDRRSRTCAIRKNCGWRRACCSAVTVDFRHCHRRPYRGRRTPSRWPTDGSRRHRLGIQYADECLELGLTWRRDYEQIGSFRKGAPSCFTWR